jgi:CheY-like chemotaxis protein
VGFEVGVVVAGRATVYEDERRPFAESPTIGHKCRTVDIEPQPRPVHLDLHPATLNHRSRDVDLLRVCPHARTVGPCDHRLVARTAVIVDDHAEFRAQAVELLEAAGYEVVGSCPDGRTALAAVAALRPDVVLLDVQLPDIDGFRVLAQLGTGAAVVLISTREAVDYGSRVARSGAAGFITKAELSVEAIARAVGSR